MRKPLTRPQLLLPIALVLVAPAARAQDDAPAAESGPAYHLEAGAVAHHRIVALGRDLVIDGDAREDAVVINGSIRIAGRVGGDVIVLDGEAHLGTTARVEGDVFVLGGGVKTASGAVIAGRSVAYPNAAAVWITLLEGPALGLPATSAVVVGAKLALLAFWAFLLLLLFAVGRRELVSTSESVRVEPLRNFLLGLTGVVAMLLTALFFSAFSGPLLGVPLLILVMVVALVLRFWGMVAVFHALGSWLCRLLRLRRQLPLVAATYGLIALGILKFVPWVGSWSWAAATFIGVGATLGTKFGRREAWIEGV
jgi:hypothetical protein